MDAFPTGRAPADCRADVGCPVKRFPLSWPSSAGITVPVLYIEAAGGAGGDTGRQTLAFLPQADVTELILQLHPDDERGLDFAHIDLWLADNAPEML